MTGPKDTAPSVTIDQRRPKRADARHNYDAVVEAAREAFAKEGVSASLEDIARRAGVGIGTLYRHFPSRKDLFESVYVAEVERLCHTAETLRLAPPWQALTTWLRGIVNYAVSKRALAEELVNSVGPGSPYFDLCRTYVFTSGGPLLERAQREGAVRKDVSFDDLLRLIGGIALAKFPQPGQLERVLNVALDGLRPPLSDYAVPMGN